MLSSIVDIVGIHFGTASLGRRISSSTSSALPLMALLVACGGEVGSGGPSGDETTRPAVTREDGVGTDEAAIDPSATGQHPTPETILTPPSEPPPTHTDVEPPPPGKPSNGALQTSNECIVLPTMEPRAPASSYAESCAATTLTTTPEASSSDSDARGFLVGRWQLCGDDAPFGQTGHAGLEFGTNGRVQLLEHIGSGLFPLFGGATASYTLLASGQFMLRGDLSLDDYATFVRFDASFDALEFDAFGTTYRYARVAPDIESAAANRFSTGDSHCSMAGTWDTQSDSPNRPAAFAFDADGEWIGGTRGSDLCQQHSMYGTYELSDDGFHLVTNVGAGSCDYWFDAYFSATFSDDCQQVKLEMTGDNCTGGRGYLNWPGDVLVRR